MSSIARALPPVPAAAAARSDVAAFLTRYGLGVLTRALPADRFGVAVSRLLVASIMRTFGSTPRGTDVRPVAEPKGEWVRAPGVAFGSRVVYYIHGSGYVVCSARTHRSLAARLSAETGLPVFVVDYRLAPEHPFPAAADDVEAGYRWLLESGHAAGDIVIAGDSAGGHLACDLLLNTAAATERPAAVVLFSPLIDVTFRLAAEQERVREDPMTSAASGRAFVDLYTRSQPPDSPRLNLDFSRAADLPPFLVQVGSIEMLSADARHLHRRLADCGGSCTLEVWPGQLHVFQALPRLTKDADAALLRAADFIATALDGPTRLDQRSEVS